MKALKCGYLPKKGRPKHIDFLPNSGNDVTLTLPMFWYYPPKRLKVEL